VRALLSSRKAILTKCIDLENELRGLLKVIGVRLPIRVGHGAFDALVRQHVESHPDWAPALLPMLEARTMLYKTFLKLEYAVRALARNDSVCRRLMTVPGIGPVTAAQRVTRAR
jgi:transposase